MPGRGRGEAEGQGRGPPGREDVEMLAHYGREQIMSLQGRLSRWVLSVAALKRHPRSPNLGGNGDIREHGPLENSLISHLAYVPGPP